MSDNNDFLRTGSGNFRLRADVTALMLKGAGYAALVCVVVGLCLWLLAALGLLLPEQSRDTPDPTPYSDVPALRASDIG
ncbi:hypothetical protein BOO69_19370 (plasmid) [Sulfitobacter alexandrii]|uniref:Uncharacterized protein n=1 Tax=Sulfitobacter alexandrii TaxID=1917485 RepID=A0A1J0WN89_9RHOB|nr:RC-LH1 core complex protein PufX [Sulfitobacter alexandrii]APE45715.1 hypothetical protein BOO69_19370 [Sulfitobacter alexandrii]